MKKEATGGGWTRGEKLLVAALLPLMAALTWVGLEAQPGHRGPSALAPNPNIRSVAVEAAPGDSVDVTTTWGVALVRPGGFVAELHVLEVADAAGAVFSATDSLAAAEASGTTMASTLRVPADTVDVAAEACVQAHHSGLSSQRRCSSFTVPGRMILEDPTAPDVQVEIDSVAVLPDSATIAVGDSLQFTAWVFSGDAVVGCSGACLESATVPMQPVMLAANGEAFYLRWKHGGEEQPEGVEGPTWVEPYNRSIFDQRQPLLAALWRQRLGKS